jgi:hypothetical protein
MANTFTLAKPKIFTQDEMFKYFGKPNNTGKGYLVTIELPYTMYYDKNPVKKMSCHKSVAKAFLNVFNDLLSHYGEKKINELEINDYGGCFNYRLMRGSNSKLSMHSWGTAIDLDANRNTLKETSKTARFARPEYKPMIDIFYKHGFISLGREKNYDWMHFQYGLIP